MAQKKDKTQTLTYEYKKSSDYKIYTVDGGIGGLNSTGGIVLNLYSESPVIPEKQVCNILENGKLEEPPPFKNNILVRNVLFGLSLTAQQAKSISEWLNRNVENLEKLRKQQAQK